MAAISVADGDDVRLEVVDSELRVRPFRAGLARVRAMVRAQVPDEVSLTEEDRRSASARE